MSYIAKSVEASVAHSVHRVPVGTKPVGIMSACVDGVAGGRVTTGGAPHNPRPSVYTHEYAILGTAPGGRIDLSRLDHFQTRPNGWLQGAEVWVSTMTDVGGLPVYEHTQIGVVSQCIVHTNVKRTPVVDTGDYFFSWPSYHRKEGQPAYFWARTIENSTGNFSAWTPYLEFTMPVGHEASTITNATTEAAIANGVLDINLAPPTGLSVVAEQSGQVARASFTPAAGDVSTQFAYTDGPEISEDSYIIVDGYDTTTIPPGSVAYLKKEFPASTTRAEFKFSRIWTDNPSSRDFLRHSFNQTNGQNGLALHSYEEDGQPVLRITNTSAGALFVQKFFHGALTQSFWTHLVAGRVYEGAFYLRSSAETEVEIRFSVVTNGTSHNLQLTTEFVEYKVQFSRDTANAAGPEGAAQLYIPAGGVVEIGVNPVNGASWAIYEQDYPPGSIDPIDAAVAADVEIVRLHGDIKTRPNSYGLAGFTDWARHHGDLVYLRDNSSPTPKIPWVQPESHGDRQFFLGLWEYWCATYDPENQDHVASRPWARKRHNQGQTAPWFGPGGVFPYMFFEAGNEEWQAGALPAFYPAPSISGYSRGTVYGARLDWIIEIFEDSPYFDASVLGGVDENGRYENVVLGGWVSQISSGWTADAAARSRKAEWVTLADYNGGWDNGEPPPSYDPYPLQKVVGIVTNRTVAVGRGPALQQLAQAHGMKAGQYEAGPGYALNGLNGAVVTFEQQEIQSMIMKGPGVAGATLSTSLLRAIDGFTLLNFFTMGNASGARTWHSHSPVSEGGKANMPWAMGVRFWNQNLLGGLASAGAPARAETIDMPNVSAVDPIRTYRVDHNDRIFLIAHNQDTTATRQVSLLTPLEEELNCTRHYVDCSVAIAAGRVTYETQYLSHNTLALNQDDAVMAEEEVAVYATPFRVTLPPGMMEIYEFTLPA